MSTIYCRLIFHDFPEIYINEFVKLAHEFQYRTVHQLIIEPAVSLDSDSFEKKTEVPFSFELKAAAEGRRLGKTERYQKICLALAELSTAVESFRGHCFHYGLSKSATAIMTILSRNIYPQFFNLQNVFSMEKLAFGSINNRRIFAPTFIFDEPTNERNEDQIFKQYLDEQRGLQDIGSNMLICFEHDREMLTVCFPDVFRNGRSDNNNDSSLNRIIDIRVSYSAIRRLIVTMSTDESGEIKVSFTFQLAYPPTIYVCQMSTGGVGEYNTKFKQPIRFLTWNQGYDIQRSVAHGSCLVADCRFVDARTLLDCLDRLRKINNCAIEFRALFRERCVNIKNYERNRFMHPDDLPSEYAKLKEQKYFPFDLCGSSVDFSRWFNL
uniref:PH-like domain-containing protein n=1 Tax=Panagrolaimus superbus TaxID=310955 RepID=A0A914XUP3_9BILA